VINTVLCGSQHYSLLLSSKFSGFTVTVNPTSTLWNNVSLVAMTVGICNTSETLTAKTFSETTIYTLLWNGTDQQAHLNFEYCFGISSLLTEIPIQIEFELYHSEVVLEHSSINLAETMMFETENLLVSLQLRDQWNNTVEVKSKAVEVWDEEGNILGKATTELKYNATLEGGQFISKKGIYLSAVNGSSPHTTFYGTGQISCLIHGF